VYPLVVPRRRRAVEEFGNPRAVEPWDPLRGGTCRIIVRGIDDEVIGRSRLVLVRGVPDSDLFTDAQMIPMGNDELLLAVVVVDAGLAVLVGRRPGMLGSAAPTDDGAASITLVDDVATDGQAVGQASRARLAEEVARHVVAHLAPLLASADDAPFKSVAEYARYGRISTRTVRYLLKEMTEGEHFHREGRTGRRVLIHVREADAWRAGRKPASVRACSIENLAIDEVTRRRARVALQKRAPR
jgi:hypothetical protein